MTKRCIYRIKNNTGVHALELKDAGNSIVRNSTLYRGEICQVFSNSVFENEDAFTKSVNMMTVGVYVHHLVQPVIYDDIELTNIYRGEGVTYEFHRKDKVPHINKEIDPIFLGTIGEPFLYLGHRNDGYLIEIIIDVKPVGEGFYEYKLSVNDGANPAGAEPFRETLLKRTQRLSEDSFYDAWTEGDPIEHVSSGNTDTPLFFD